MTDKMVTLLAPGGTDRFRIEDQPELRPGAGEILIRHHAIGMNFVDIYHRKGIYPLPAYPAILGVEAAGMVAAVGPGVENLRQGDRVAYAASVGAYAARRLLPAERAVRLPDDVSDRMAAASMLKGMTAYMLLRRTYRVGAGTTVLVHAAAGGLGSILVPLAKQLGATVLGTAGSEEKAALARGYGADHVIVGRNADIVAKVGELTGGRGVDVAYDGIGGDTLAKTIRCLGRFGTAVTIGQAGGPIPPISAADLAPGRSLTHASIMAFSADPANYREAAEAAVAALKSGIGAAIAGEYPLEQTAEAQRSLEDGGTAGALLLIP